MSSTNGTILEDDQQLYDWGIENRLDQYEYYQVSSGLKNFSQEVVSAHVSLSWADTLESNLSTRMCGEKQLVN